MFDDGEGNQVCGFVRHSGNGCVDFTTRLFTRLYCINFAIRYFIYSIVFFLFSSVFGFISIIII